MTRIWNGRFSPQTMEQLQELAAISRRTATDIVRLLIEREYSDLHEGKARVATPILPQTKERPTKQAAARVS